MRSAETSLLRIADVRRYISVQDMVSELAADLLPDHTDRVQVYRDLFGDVGCARGFVAMRLEWPNEASAAQASSCSGFEQPLAKNARVATEVASSGGAHSAVSSDAQEVLMLQLPPRHYHNHKEKMIAENFEKIFRKKITKTHAAAAAAKTALGWQ